MNLLFSCIGKRGYIAEYFRECLAPGDRIIGTSNTRWTSGFAACDEAVLMPPISDPDYGEAVLDLCRSKNISAVLSFFDPDVVALSRIRGQLAALGVVPILPSERVATACFDKYATYHFLREGGFNTPATFVDLQEVYQGLEQKELQFPLMIKPRCGFGSRDNFIAKNRRQLEVFFELRPDMMVQQFIQGDAYNFDVCNDLNGNPLSLVVWRKLRSTLGETENVITCEQPALFELGVQLARYVGQIGPMDVDLFYQEGVATVLELNPRFGGGYPASHLAGGDFPRLIMKMIRGQNPAHRLGDYRRGMVMLKAPRVMGGDQQTFWRNELHLSETLPPEQI